MHSGSVGNMSLWHSQPLHGPILLVLQNEGRCADFFAHANVSWQIKLICDRFRVCNLPLVFHVLSSWFPLVNKKSLLRGSSPTSNFVCCHGELNRKKCKVILLESVQGGLAISHFLLDRHSPGQCLCTQLHLVPDKAITFVCKKKKVNFCLWYENAFFITS